MRQLSRASGLSLPVLGLGSYGLGEASARRPAEVALVRQAIEMGCRLFDTAEMYADGGAEAVIGRALADALRAGDVRREELVIVSKVLPGNASRQGTPAACARSLARLGLDQIDLYLLHWRGPHPLAETIEAMQRLAAADTVRRWGVSNFDTDDMAELATLAGMGVDDPAACACNQVYFSLSQRGVEFDLLPWMKARGVPLMAYSPIDQGRIAQDPLLAEIGQALGCSAARVALAWVLSRPGVVAIPKAARPAHLRDNWAALDLVLDAPTLQRLDARFPPPAHKTPLATT